MPPTQRRVPHWLLLLQALPLIQAWIPIASVTPPMDGVGHSTRDTPVASKAPPNETDFPAPS